MGWPNDRAVKRAAGACAEKGIWLSDDEGDHDALVSEVLTVAGLPELVGSTDTAKIYGVESSNLGRVSGLPDPLYGPGLEPPRYVRAGNLYDADEVRAHAASRKAAA